MIINLVKIIEAKRQADALLRAVEIAEISQRRRLETVLSDLLLELEVA